jgi:hypothetical protein
MGVIFMGSTLESTIVFSIILIILAALIVGPATILFDCSKCEYYFTQELEFHSEDERILSNEQIDRANSTCISQEQMNSFLSGLSYCYRLIYEDIVEVVS